MTSAFICYSRADKEVADYIAAQLRSRQVDAFVDYQNLRNGGFMKQLGQEIERRDYFIPVISPCSVASDWVQAEVTWAFTNRKRLIPIRYKPADMANVFVLDAMESVDFAQWHSNRDMNEAVSRLMSLMNVSTDPATDAEIPEPELVKSKARIKEAGESLDAGDAPPAPPSFTKGEVQRMFETAASVQDSDPEQALFLYSQVLEFDPDFMNGEIKGFVERQIDKLKPNRLRILKERIQYAREKGYWADVKQLANTILSVDPNNQEATALIKITNKNAECEPVYEHAKTASKNGNNTAVAVLMQDIQERCPNYGDPAGLLTNQQISRPLTGYLHDSYTLIGHLGAINKVAFSYSSKVLATASDDHTVRIWSTATGELLNDLSMHSGGVNSVAFSPDESTCASVSADGKVQIWHVQTWERIQMVKVLTSANDVVFSQDSSLLIVGDDNGLLSIFSVPDLAFLNAIPVNRGRLTSLDVSIDGRLFVSSVQELDYYNSYSSIGVWNTRNWNMINMDTWKNHERGIVNNIMISSDSKYVAAVGNSLDVWKMPQARSCLSVNLSHMDVPDFGMGSSRESESLKVSGQDLTFMPQDSSMLILAGAYNEVGKIVILDLTDNSIVSALTTHDETVNSVAVSKNGRMIATGSDDCTAKIWQL
ncbi:MAG: TIR domain-containing protein [Chloroflexi bacterium]|nr:TIR domain-containing protein [Chloroflexota bacterium]